MNGQCQEKCECYGSDIERLLRSHINRIAYMIQKRMRTTPGRCYYGGKGAWPTADNSTQQFLDVWASCMAKVDRANYDPKNGAFWPYARTILNSHLAIVAWAVSKGFDPYDASRAWKRQQKEEARLMRLSDEGDREAHELLSAHRRGDIDLYPTTRDSAILNQSLHELEEDCTELLCGLPEANHDWLILALQRLDERKKGNAKLRQRAKSLGLYERYPDYRQQEAFSD